MGTGFPRNCVRHATTTLTQNGGGRRDHESVFKLDLGLASRLYRLFGIQPIDIIGKSGLSVETRSEEVGTKRGKTFQEGARLISPLGMSE